MNIHFAAFLISLITSAVLEIFPSGTAFNATSDVFYIMPKVFLGFPWPRRLLFDGDDSFFSISSFTNWADPSSLSRKPRPELCRNVGHSRSLFGRNPANHAPPPGWSQKIDHDNSWCERKACAFGLGMDPMATRMSCALLSCRCLCRNLLVQILLMFLNLRFSRIQYDTDIVRVLFESLCERTSIYQKILPAWPCEALIYMSSSLTTLLWILWHNGWPVIVAPFFQQTSYLSLFVWLESVSTRIWYGGNPVSC